MNKKFIIGGGLLLSVLSLGVLVANAETSTTTTTSVNNPSPMMINIGPKGNVMLRGTVVSVDASSLTVKSWGGSWTVRTKSTTKIMSTNKALSDFKADDTVGVVGDISQDGTFIIDATILRQWGKKVDTDKDGIPDNQDDDDDNDGLPNKEDQKHNDHDNDGIIDSVDTDDDNDGIPDATDTMPFDANNDGIPDGRDQHEGRGRGPKDMMRLLDPNGKPKMDDRGDDNRGENRGPSGMN